MWSNGKKCAVVLGFCFDAESMWTGTLGLTSAAYLARGEYGARVGIPRILSLLDKHNIHATFFIPGDTIDRHPDEVREIHARGHEIGHQGYSHKSPTTFEPGEEKKDLERALEALDKLVQTQLTGYSSPAWDFSPNTLPILSELGFIYDSSLMADDFELFRLKENEQDAGIVELPVSWELDDVPYFLFNVFPSFTGLSDPDKVYKIWAKEFEGAYAAGGVFNLTMHPQVIGRHHRIVMLDRLLQFISNHDDVWFATGIEIVTDWLARQDGA